MIVRLWPSGELMAVGIGTALHGGLTEFTITKHDTKDLWEHHDEFIAWFEETIIPRMMPSDADS